MTTKAPFFSVKNDGCGMGECGKGGQEWVRVGKSDIFLKVWERGERVGESEQGLNGGVCEERKEWVRARKSGIFV